MLTVALTTELMWLALCKAVMLIIYSVYIFMVMMGGLLRMITVKNV